MPGDFVNLGSFKAGTLLDFFLISNGANGGNNVFSSTDSKLNTDRINHVVSFTQVNSPYVLVSFEDMYGGGIGTTTTRSSPCTLGNVTSRRC